MENELQPTEPQAQLIVGENSIKKATKVANELAKLINKQNYSPSFKIENSSRSKAGTP
jgi:hypothetical protein